MVTTWFDRIRDGIQTPNRKRDYNWRLFTRVAPKYDFATRALSLGRDRAWKRRLLAALPHGTAPRCVDLACGTGDVTFLLAAQYPEGEIVGVDLTPFMLEIARERSRRAHVRFHQEDMCRMTFPDAWADIVTGSYALRNAPDLGRALREIHRILKPGGIAAFLDFSKPPGLLRQRAELAVLCAWGSLWGWVLHGDPAVYAYIAESLAQFPDRKAFRRLLQANGFRVVRSELFCFGALECVVVRKAAVQ